MIDVEVPCSPEVGNALSKPLTLSSLLFFSVMRDIASTVKVMSDRNKNLHR